VWVVVAIVVVSFAMTHVTLADVTWDQLGPVLRSFWPPRLGAHSVGEYFDALLVTFQVAFAAALLSLILSLVFGSLAARNVAPNPTVRATFRVVLVIIRGIPELVLAIFLIMVTALGNQAGAIALAVGGVGLLGKLIADSPKEAPSRPERALTAAGATRGQRYLVATVPQSLPPLIGNNMCLVDTVRRRSSGSWADPGSASI